MNTNVSTFMSVTNLKTLLDIFKTFLKERYAVGHNNTNINLKEILYETMIKISNDQEYRHLTMTDLNKVTLSVVKNVVINMLSLEVDRPRNNDAKHSTDLNKQFQIMSKTRDYESKENEMRDKPETISVANKSISEEDFMKSLKELEKTRNVDSELSKTFENNLLADQKAIFTGIENKELEIASSNVVEEKDFIIARENIILPEKKPDILKKYFIIDSRERNIDVYPDPNNYVINIESTLRNVISVELLYAIYVKNGTEFYVNLQIDELMNDTISTSTEAKKAFVQLPLLEYYNEFTSHRTSAYKEFIQPLSKLNRFTISFKNFQGEYHSIGDHFMKFEIKHYNSISNMEEDRNESTNLNHFQDNLQEEIFMSHNEEDL